MKLWPAVGHDDGILGVVTHIGRLTRYKGVGRQQAGGKAVAEPYFSKAAEG